MEDIERSIGTMPCECPVTCDSVVIPLAIARHAPLFMGFFKQECWSGLPFPPPGDLLDPGIESESSVSPALQADSLPAVPLRKTAVGGGKGEFWRECGHCQSSYKMLSSSKIVSCLFNRIIHK